MMRHGFHVENIDQHPAIAGVTVNENADPSVRRDIAMTGEITLRGKVLAIGGLKEKLLAALRAGRMPIYEPGLEKLVADNVAAGRLRFTTDLAAGIADIVSSFVRPQICIQQRLERGPCCAEHTEGLVHC